MTDPFRGIGGGHPYLSGEAWDRPVPHADTGFATLHWDGKQAISRADAEPVTDDEDKEAETADAEAPDTDEAAND